MTLKQLKYKIIYGVSSNKIVEFIYHLWPQKCRWLGESHEGKVRWMSVFSDQLTFPMCEKHYAEHFKVMETYRNYVDISIEDIIK